DEADKKPDAAEDGFEEGARDCTNYLNDKFPDALHNRDMGIPPRVSRASQSLHVVFPRLGAGTTRGGAPRPNQSQQHAAGFKPEPQNWAIVNSAPGRSSR